MKKNLFIKFKLLAVVLLSAILTNENIFANNDILYIEIVECQIEEEGEIDAISNEIFNESNCIGNDGAKKEVSVINYKTREFEGNNLVNNSINCTYPKRYFYHVPNYILYCSLVIYS